MSAPRPTARKGTRSPVAFTLPLALALAVAGCGEPEGMPLTVRFAPGGAMTVTVSDESGRTSPTYQWTGGQASNLTVRALDTGEIFWRIRAPGANGGFVAPVEHGIVPLEAEVVTQHRILEPDVEYQIVVVGVDGLEGTTTFVP